MKKHLFGQNRVIYNVYNNSYPGRHFNNFMNRKTVLIVSFIALAVGVYVLLQGSLYTQQVDFKVTSARPNIQTTYDYDGSMSYKTTYDLYGKVDGICGGQTVAMLGYNSLVNNGDTIKAWVKEGCDGLVAEYDVEGKKMIGVVIILAAAGVIAFNIVKKG